MQPEGSSLSTSSAYAILLQPRALPQTSMQVAGSEQAILSGNKIRAAIPGKTIIKSGRIFK